MIPKFPYGPANLHILSSDGPSPYVNQFYSTTYSTNYKSAKEEDEERLKKADDTLRHK